MAKFLVLALFLKNNNLKTDLNAVQRFNPKMDLKAFQCFLNEKDLHIIACLYMLCYHLKTWLMVTGKIGYDCRYFGHR